MRKDAEVLQLVQREEEEVKRRLLEVEFLETVGIYVHDSMLALDAGRLRVLPQFTRMAELRWSQLYDSISHKNLTHAITKQLRMNYDAAKNINLTEALTT